MTKMGGESRMHEIDETHTSRVIYEYPECKNPLWYLVEIGVIILKGNILTK
jgi:hypothetical protein